MRSETGYVEAHISTFEPGPQAPARFPRAHGDQGGPQDPECTPCTGPEEAERLTPSDRSVWDRRGKPTAVLSFLKVGVRPPVLKRGTSRGYFGQREACFREVAARCV